MNEFYNYIVTQNTFFQEKPPSVQERIVIEALKLVGSPSKKYTDPLSGMDPEEGLDCSGYVRKVYEKANCPIPPDIRHARQLFDSFGVLVHPGLQQAGDLAFFSWDGLYPNHVAIMISPFAYAHSPGKDKRIVHVKVLKGYEEIPMTPGQIYKINPIGFKRPAVKKGSWRIPEW